MLFNLVLGSTYSHAQELSQYSTSDLKYLSGEAESMGDFLTAAEYYNELSSRKPKNENYQYQLARNLHKSSQFSKAKEVYSRLVNAEKIEFPLAPFYLARLMIMDGDCENAVPLLDQFRKDYRGEKDDSKYRRIAKFSIEACTELQTPEQDNMIIKPLSPEINGPNMEGAPIFESEDRMIYNSLGASSSAEFDPESDELPTPSFYLAQKQNGEWRKEAIWDQIKLEDGYYPVSGTFNADKSRLYLSACKDIYTSQKLCDIFRIDLSGGKIGKAEKLGDGISTESQERHPAVGIDEKGRETLYFVSDREDGKGGLDVWYSTYYEKKDSYREPKNCGSKVNSVGDEITPFIDPESGELYYSSDAHPGFGGFDIFRSVGNRSKWKEPENIGSKINGSMDEIYYALDPSGQSGFFVSNRVYNKKKQPCCDDLFYFTDPDLVRLNYKGQIKDEEGDGLPNAAISIYEIDDSTGESFLRKRVLTDDKGNFDFRLEPDKKYTIKGEKEGFFITDKDISTLEKISSQNHQFNLVLKQITDEAFILKNIYYDFDESVLTDRARITIDTTIFEILDQNPTLVVEIGSHTDSKGRSDYNQTLSQRRAESVVKYLIKNGIRRDRLKAKGYGESVPVAQNSFDDGSDNPEGRAKNRRTEFRVIGKIKIVDTDD